MTKVCSVLCVCVLVGVYFCVTAEFIVLCNSYFGGTCFCQFDITIVYSCISV